MKCPKCGEEMGAVKRDISKNFQIKPPKEYNRNVYVCKKDDVWITSEIPVDSKE